MYGQLVIGPPGSGKSTYCAAMRAALAASGRKVAIVNLDPANEQCECDVDVRDLVELSEVVERLGLGPNGGLVFCIEYMAKNMDWLKEELDGLDPASYLIFDCPGQVELYIHNESMKAAVTLMTEEWNIRLAAVNLIDSMQCHEPSRYISALSTSLAMMLQLELPHVNVLSKVDLFESTGENLPFKLDFYSDVMDLSYLTEAIEDDPYTAKFGKLTAAIGSMVEDFGLVQYIPMCINDDASVKAVSAAIDRANGYVFNPTEHNEPEFVDPEQHRDGG